MKRYKFPLDKVLMLRDFEEYKEKIKLGRINEKIVEVKDHIEKIENDLRIIYQNQEMDTKKGLKAKGITLYSFAILSYRAKRRDLEAELVKLNQQYENQLEVLLEKRNKVKILKKMKDKDYKEFRKEELYKESNNLDEMVNNRFKARYGL